MRFLVVDESSTMRRIIVETLRAGVNSDIVKPCAWHHDWTQARHEPRKAAITCLANRLSHRYGFGGVTDPAELLGDPVVAHLGPVAAWLSATDSRVPGLFDVARRILG